MKLLERIKMLMLLKVAMILTFVFLISAGTGGAQPLCSPHYEITADAPDRRASLGQDVFLHAKITAEYIDRDCNQGEPEDITDRATLQDIKWEWESLPPGSVATISNGDTLNPSFKADKLGVYSLRLTGKASYRGDKNALDTLAKITVDKPAPPTAQFDWIMANNFGYRLDVNYITELVPPKSVIHHPEGWRVTLSACSSSIGSSEIQEYAWKIDGVPVPGPGSECNFFYTFPKLGTYRVELTVTAEDGQSDSVSRDVVVKDILIVSIGDSVASGEGNPDKPQQIERILGVPWVTEGPVWADTRCHRSAKSGPARAALAMEYADDHTSVTFISLACSGAKIDKGLLEGYRGIEPPPGSSDSDFPSQIDQLAGMLCPNGNACSRDDQRQIDALFISIGANDLDFSGILTKCAEDIIDPGAPPCSSLGDVRETLRKGLAALPDKYALLRNRLQEKLKVSKIFITEYFNPLHDDDSELCNRILLGVTRDEAEWAEKQLIEPLNQKVKDAAGNDWIYIGDIASQFVRDPQKGRGHGYCADDHWVVQLLESHVLQGPDNPLYIDIFQVKKTKGVMHPNSKGHTVYKDRIIEELKKSGVVSGGLVLKGSISGMKFNDFNGDGIKDLGEPGLEGWEIKLTMANGRIISTTTDTSGEYSFIGLADGTYTVGETLKAGYIQTMPGVSETGSVTRTVEIKGGSDVMDIDYGNFKISEVHGMKWEDLNANGKKDSGEKGLAGWEINIKGTDTITGKEVDITTTTDMIGNYQFMGLTAGKYVISEKLQDGWVQTTPTTGTHTVIITSGAVIKEQDFGNFKKGKINGWGLLGTRASPNAEFNIFGFYPTSFAGAQGTVEVKDHIANLNIKSFQINTVATTIDKKKGVITGLAKVNDAGSYYFEVYVEDNKDPGGGIDVFRISLPDYKPPIGYSNGGVLGFGNIRIK